MELNEEMHTLRYGGHTESYMKIQLGQAETKIAQWAAEKSREVEEMQEEYRVKEEELRKREEEWGKEAEK